MFAIVKYLKFGTTGVDLNDKEYTYQVNGDDFNVGDVILAGKYKSPALVINKTDEEPEHIRTVDKSGKTLEEYLAIPKF